MLRLGRSHKNMVNRCFHALANVQFVYMKPENKTSMNKGGGRFFDLHISLTKCLHL